MALVDAYRLSKADSRRGLETLKVLGVIPGLYELLKGGLSRGLGFRI